MPTTPLGGKGGGVWSKILPNPPDRTRLSGKIVKSGSFRNPDKWVLGSVVLRDQLGWQHGSLEGHRVVTVTSCAPVLMERPVAPVTEGRRTTYKAKTG